MNISNRKRMDSDTVSYLEGLSRAVRRDIIAMIYAAQSGNPGSALSAVEVLVYLYYHEMSFKPEDPNWMERDRFILSKGHAAPALYSILAQLGVFPREELITFRQFNSRLQTHPEYRTLPGIDFPSGSLGQGLSAGVGMALGLRVLQKTSRVFVFLGDGELQEGQVWEAAMSAGHYGLGSLFAFVDHNKYQDNDHLSKVMEVAPLAEKWKAFGWNVIETDGHRFEGLESSFRELEMADSSPKVIICHTTKGKGISFMEHSNAWHRVNGMSDEDRDRALAALEI